VKRKKTVVGFDTQPWRDLTAATSFCSWASLRQTVVCETVSVQPLAGNAIVSTTEPAKVELYSMYVLVVPDPW